MGNILQVLRLWILLFVLHSRSSQNDAVRFHRVKRWLSSGAVKCAFNPCSVSGFCGTGRTCEMGDNCRHNCECEPGSTHKKCVEMALEQKATPKPMKCTFNPCASPAFACDGGRNCVLDEHCMPGCECLDDSTHPSCQGKIETTTEQTERDKCKTDESLCIHGHCTHDADQYTCDCDKGWGGDTCNESICTKQCSKGFYCHFVTSSVQVCVESISTPPTVSTITVTTETGETRVSNVCDVEYMTRDKEEKECSLGITCKYGVCTADRDGELCKCDFGASGTHCEYKCCRDCGDFGTCFLDSDLEEICTCHVNYTGINCTELRSDLTNATYAPPEEVTWHLWVVGACVIVLLILLTLMVVVPYILWRNRVILVMKVVHYFQGYEDDDDRQWDAFISYKSTKSDETFVVKTLFPKLEKELGFKVNVHFRDFMPGETIANNIITAVQSSRRTIMIITPSYVTSEFTKFEYQVAQQEMLKRKHRIIPILLDDITECKDTIDPNLKVILNSVTYIQWPQDGNEKKLDKFWKRLELSMPKIKNRTMDSNNAKVSSNGSVSMTKPEDVSISFSKDKNNPKSELSNGNTNIYSIIDERKLEPEEVYDTLNESEMQSKMIKMQTEFDGNPKQDKNLNVLKVNL